MAGRPPPRRNNDRAELIGNAPKKVPQTYSPTDMGEDDRVLAHQQRIQELQQEQKKFLTEAVRTSHSTIGTGDATIQELNRQGETIDRVDKGVDNIEYELKVSDKLVKNMSGLTGMVASWFMRDPKPKKSKATCCTAESTAVRSDEQRAKYASERKTSELTSASSATTSNPHDVEADKLLNELANNLSVMRDQAHTQQEILRTQHKQLDALSAKVDKTNQHMRKTESNIKKIT